VPVRRVMGDPGGPTRSTEHHGLGAVGPGEPEPGDEERLP